MTLDEDIFGSSSTDMGDQQTPSDMEKEAFGSSGTESAEAKVVRNIDVPASEGTGEFFEGGLEILQDSGHEMVPVMDSYVRRRIDAHTQDVELLSYMMGTGRPVLLTAQTGVGKDALIEHICWETNRPMVRVNFGEGITYSDLVGEFKPVEGADGTKVEKARKIADELDIDIQKAASLVSEEGMFEFSPGWLYLAVKNGWVFVADEINAAGPDATMPLHGVTESPAFLTVLQTSEKITPHPEFRFVATRNPPEYAGTKPMNDAFQSRFWPFPLDYLPEGGEKVMLQKSTSLDKDEHNEVLNGITSLAAKLRESHKHRDIVTPVSHRDTMKIGDLIGDGMMEPESACEFVLEGIAAREDRNAINKAINSTSFGN